MVGVGVGGPGSAFASRAVRALTRKRAFFPSDIEDLVSHLTIFYFRQLQMRQFWREQERIQV